MLNGKIITLNVLVNGCKALSWFSKVLNSVNGICMSGQVQAELVLLLGIEEVLCAGFI